MMLSTVIGNISSSGKVKLIDLEFPKSFLAGFKGPKFGVQGIRDLLGVQDLSLIHISATSARGAGSFRALRGRSKSSEKQP